MVFDSQSQFLELLQRNGARQSALQFLLNLLFNSKLFDRKSSQPLSRFRLQGVYHESPPIIFIALTRWESVRTDTRWN